LPNTYQFAGAAVVLRGWPALLALLVGA